MKYNLYRIKATEPFLEEIDKKFDNKEKLKFNKFKDKLKNSAYIGDQLRVPFFREFKTNKGKRAYFLIYEDIKLILFVAISNKKNQEKIINRIYENLNEFKKYVYENYKS